MLMRGILAIRVVTMKLKLLAPLDGSRTFTSSGPNCLDVLATGGVRFVNDGAILRFDTGWKP
jgi:hypothetical protein